METSPKKQNHTLSTILTLGGIFLGAFLITKLTRQETSEPSSSKESGVGEKEKKSEIKIEKVEEEIPGLNNRQARMLKVVKEQGIITPKDMQKLIPDVSSRTLRRDMDVLAKEKYISQKGSTKSTFYKYIGR